jgi:hypothetical protein
MLTTQPLDVIPIYLVFPVTVLLGLIAAEIGFRIGEWWQARSQEDKDPSVGPMVGASLALLAFLLAFLIGSAGDRFNARRVLVVDDANAIGTTELRARYLPEPYSTQSRTLLKEYVTVRIPTPANSNLATIVARSEEIQNQLWQYVVELVNQGQSSDVFALYVDALNHMIDVHGERNAAINSRVAPTVLLGVYFVALLGMMLVGFNSGIEGRRSWIALIVLVLMFAAVITLIVDLDRPAEGFLIISQQPMLDLQRQLGQ